MQPANDAMNIEGDDESADQSSEYSLPSDVDPNDKDQVQDHVVQKYLRDL